MEKIVGKNKKPREIAAVILIVLLLCVLFFYVVYVAATYINSKSPGDFKDFSRSDIWLATGDDFSMKIDLTAANAESGVIESMVATLTYKEKQYNLSVSESGGHGTIFAPLRPVKF